MKDNNNPSGGGGRREVASFVKLYDNYIGHRALVGYCLNCDKERTGVNFLTRSETSLPGLVPRRREHDLYGIHLEDRP